ncbi:MAG: hypothetical protein QXF70_00815 [Candidatus Bilamarchaeaceae archaeon]
MKKFFYVLGLVVILLFTMTTLCVAQTTGNQPTEIRTATGSFWVSQSGEKGNNITVAVIVPLADVVSAEQQKEADEILKQVREYCDKLSYPSTFYNNKDECFVLQAQQQLRSASIKYTSIKNAKIGFAYYNPVTSSYQPLDTCGGALGMQANTEVYDSQYDTILYQTSCVVPAEVYRGIKTTILISYLQNGEVVELVLNNQPQKYAVYVEPRQVTISDVKVSTIDAIYNAITQGISGATQQNPVACLGLFLVLGLFLASMYFSGRSPMSLLDITTPRMPSPPGLEAGGQVVLPYGYQELKKTAMQKLGAGATALSASISRLVSTDNKVATEWNRVRTTIDKLNPDPQQRAVMEALAASALANGKKYSDIKHLLSKLPKKYGMDEHKTVAQILGTMIQQGGSQAVMAQTIKDMLLTFRMLEGMGPLSGTPKSKVGQKIVTGLTNVVGPNRYNMASTMIVGSIGSIVRTGRTVRSVSKEMVKTAPELARGVARSFIALSPTGMERLRKTAGEEGISGAIARQILKEPSKGMEVGKKVAIDEKMERYYEKLLEESKMNVLTYILKQGYKALGVNFALSEKDILEFALKDIDILEKCGYAKNAAKIQMMEKELLAALAAAKTTDEKINAALSVVQKYGAVIDQGMFRFLDRLNAIDKSKEEGFLKFIALQEFLLYHEKSMKACGVNQTNNGDKFYVVVGRSSINGSDIWEIAVLRTMLWDHANGYLKGGLKEGLQRAWLDSVNRIIGLNPTSNLNELPEFMRNKAELEKIERRIRSTIVDLMTAEGRGAFMKQYGKPPEQASIKELLDMLYGKGRLPPDMQRLKEDRFGRTAYWEDEKTLGPAAEWFKVDMKRHWVGPLDPRENFALAQWVESRFTRSNVAAYKGSIEAEIDKMPGSKNWSVTERQAVAKKLWVVDQIKMDFENKFNSQFCVGYDAYGKLSEKAAFYNNILLGFYEKAMKDKGLVENHSDLLFVKNMDTSNTVHLHKFRTEIAQKYKEAFQAELRAPISFNDIINSPRPIVQLYEGDYAYYRKGMPLSIGDKVYGEVAIRDNNRKWRKFVAEDVVIDFAKYGRNDLQLEYRKLTEEKAQPGPDWDVFMENVKKWARSGSYSYEKEQIFAALVHNYGRNTRDYMKYWNDTAIEIKPMKEVMDIAPHALRMFGVDNEKARIANTLLKNLKSEFGSYFVKTTLGGSQPIVNALYDSIPTSEYLKQHSWRLAAQIFTMRTEEMRDMNAAERAAYRDVAAAHGPYHNAWAWAIDRSVRATPSQGILQITEHSFHHGPGYLLGTIKDYIGPTMSKAEWAAFYAFYGWPADLAAKIHKPFAGMFRNVQVAMQGYPSRWDQQTDDALRPFDYTDVRLLQATRSAATAFSGSKLAKLKLWEEAAEQRQTAGEALLAGLRQSPSDIFIRRSGVESIARTGMANPGATYYDYRYELKVDEAMASYFWRNRDALYMFDKEMSDSAFRSTVRRTVSAEVLSLKYDQEIRGFGVFQNTLYGFFNPFLFAYHIPIALYPSQFTPREWLSRVAQKRRFEGEGPSFAENIVELSENLARGAYHAMTPWKGSSIVYCPKCGKSNYVGTVCRCGTVIYGVKKKEPREDYEEHYFRKAA